MAERDLATLARRNPKYEKPKRRTSAHAGISSPSEQVRFRSLRFETFGFVSDFEIRIFPGVCRIALGDLILETRRPRFLSLDDISVSRIILRQNSPITFADFTMSPLSHRVPTNAATVQSS